MTLKFRNLIHFSLLGAFLLSSCSASTPTPTPAPVQRGDLHIDLLYPTEDAEIEMGQTIKAILKVIDEQGQPVKDAVVSVSFSDPDGKIIGTIPAAFGDGDVYRTDNWTVPHHMQEGLWSLKTVADAKDSAGENSNQLVVKYSTSEILYHKYGFWLDAPTLRGIQPTIGAERGDAQNGLVRWGGQIPSQHILPENWVEIQWRKGDFKLDSPEAVRRFLLSEIGDLGFTPVREIDAFTRTKFKGWDAWEAPARAQYYYQEMVWTVFYAPEVDKTYVLGTTVTQPPSGIDAHEVLLENFAVDPSIQANGVAPAPLIPLLPQPILIGPEMGARFEGLEEPIVLKWEPLKELAEEEYYQVSVDYNYGETNTKLKYATRETELVLPEALYHLPNCAVFNWRITLMQQTGTTKTGDPTGEPLSYDSLYRYVRWVYPPDEKAPFDSHCPNAQF